MIGEFVVVRTRSAGVHVGTLIECVGTAAKLAGARRLWRWLGANTLHEVSQNGVGQGSRISEPVPAILLTEAIEIIPCSEAGKRSLGKSRWDA